MSDSPTSRRGRIRGRPLQLLIRELHGQHFAQQRLPRRILLTKFPHRQVILAQEATSESLEPYGRTRTESLTQPVPRIPSSRSLERLGHSNAAVHLFPLHQSQRAPGLQKKQVKNLLTVKVNIDVAIIEALQFFGRPATKVEIVSRVSEVNEVPMKGS